mgnify:CR=1 FL=1
MHPIDTLYFRGKNAQWQYEHYKLEVKDDSLKLIIYNDNRIIKSYKEEIMNIKIHNRSFFTFHADYYSDYRIKNNPKSYYLNNEKNKYIERDLRIINDTSKHHMLRVNPSLLLRPHNFRIILYSTKYKNMFFKKVN